MLIYKKTTNFKGYSRYLCAFVLGILACFAMPPFFVSILLIPAFSGLLLLIDQCTSKKQAFLIGWLFGWGYFITGLYWFAYALLTDADKFAWLIPFANLGIPAFIAIYYGIISYITYLMPFQKRAKVVFFAITWTIVELIRSHILTGFPWNLIGYSFAGNNSLMQLAAILGIHGIGFIVVILSASFYCYVKDKDYKPAILALITIIIIYSGGSYRLKQNPTSFVQDINLRLVQANISQDIKWQEGMEKHNLDQYMELSKDYIEAGTKYIIWPESAIPYAIDDITLRNYLSHSIPVNGYLISGTNHFSNEQGWNSLHVIDYKGNIISYYDKSHLVPFGEYVPLRSILPLDKIAHGRGDWSQGSGPKTLKINDKLPSFSPLICYEIIFPNKVIENNTSPEWLLNVTNDGWFGYTTGPHQHFHMARMRAVEQGIPLIRAANTGISAIVDSYGRVIKSLGLLEKGFIDGQLPKAITGRTFYSKHGDKSLYLMLVAALIIIIFERNGTKKNRQL